LFKVRTFEALDNDKLWWLCHDLDLKIRQFPS